MNNSHIEHTLIGQIQHFFLQAANSLFPECQIEITQSTQEAFGHYQCNSAMKLAKQLGQNPRLIAKQLVEACPESEMIQSLEIAGPGFINIRLRPEFLAKEVRRLLLPNAGIAAAHKQKIVIDFSSPNTAKEMHVGHLRSTIIGDCLARVFEFLGHDVLRLNHIGDWGTSFGMLIAYLKEVETKTLQHLSEAQLGDLVACYKKAKQHFDEDPAFKKKAQLAVVALQNGQPEETAIWETICAVSRVAYQEIYNLLDVSLIERGESFYNPQLAAVVADLEQKGLVSVSDGAKCIFLDGFSNREGEPLPLMIQKSDGGYNYDTTDMAAIRHRIDVEKADRLIYVTDAGQATHFQMIFTAAEKAGYLRREKVRVDHVPFGLVLGADGKKFKTRSGDTEKLIDLLNAAVIRAKEILAERNPDWTEEERQQLANALGIGAVKYADLACHRTSDYVFSYDRMLRFDGNTAAFIMYSYVRVLGIQRKVSSAPASRDKINLVHPSEIALGLALARFPEVLEQVTQELLPHRLTEYLYTLAEEFNAFFRDCRVEGSSEQDSRLCLVQATGEVLKKGLELLGVRPVMRM